MTQGLIVKAGRLNKSRHNMFVVAVRRSVPGPGHGEWELTSIDGYTVVCPSYLEATNWVFIIGHQVFPGGPVDDDEYLAWLLQYYFRILPHEAGPMDERGIGRHGNLEVMYDLAIRGWQPDAADILGMNPTAEMIERIMTAKKLGR
jgi:hypothetical protein